MTLRVYHGEALIGTIHDLRIDFPHLYGRWESVTSEIDNWVRSELDREGEPLVVRLGDNQNQNRYYISRLEGTEINLRMG